MCLYLWDGKGQGYSLQSTAPEAKDCVKIDKSLRSGSPSLNNVATQMKPDAYTLIKYDHNNHCSLNSDRIQLLKMRKSAVMR